MEYKKVKLEYSKFVFNKCFKTKEWKIELEKNLEFYSKK